MGEKMKLDPHFTSSTQEHLPNMIWTEKKARQKESVIYDSTSESSKEGKLVKSQDNAYLWGGEGVSFWKEHDLGWLVI